MADGVNAVAEAIDGATGDWSMSGDAMRWSPDLAEHGPAAGELRGVDIAAGAGHRASAWTWPASGGWCRGR